MEQKSICFQRTVKIIRIARTIVAACTFLFLSIIWYANMEFDSSVSTNNSVEMPPIPTIVWTSFFPWLNMDTTIKCFNRECLVVPACYRSAKGDAYLYYGYEIENTLGFPLPREEKVVWGLFHEESPSRTLAFMFEKALNIFNFSATYSRFSDVQFPLMWLGSLDSITTLEYYVNTSFKNNLLKNISPVIVVQSDCFTAVDRDEYVQKLAKYIGIDSYGGCNWNKSWPEDFKDLYLDSIDDDMFLATIAQYKFAIAIENNLCNDYITEKFWRTIKLGVVPIYFGSPLIRDWLPNNRSAILVEDFPTPQLLSAHLHELLQNDTKYEEYLEHKTKGLITNKRLLQEIKDRPYQGEITQAIKKFQCLVCERIHDRTSTLVNIVSKKHLDCPMPVSALTKVVNPSNYYVRAIRKMKSYVDQMETVFSNPNLFNASIIPMCPHDASFVHRF